MSFVDYIKEKLSFIIIEIIAIILTSLLLHGLDVDTYAIFFVGFLNFTASAFYYIYDFFNKRKFYNNLINNLNTLEDKYLISDMIKEPTFFEGKILYDVLCRTNKSMLDNIFQGKKNNEEYREYIELWVHEIKTPIAGCKLLIENNPSEITESIEEEIEKIENYIEQSLFYSRSNTVEKDYFIRKMNLRESVTKVIKRNSTMLINNRIKIELENLDTDVYSDSKWVEFVINQIISNSIKYMMEDEKILKIKAIIKLDSIILSIKDNGVGMDEKGTIKAFDKGYTGENGRKYGKSTGMGLFLCKNLCMKLGLGIKIYSNVLEGTTVNIVFPINQGLVEVLS